MTPSDLAAWFRAIAAEYWQHTDGETALATLIAAKEPTDESPETAEELQAMLTQYVAVYGQRRAARDGGAVTP